MKGLHPKSKWIFFFRFIFYQIIFIPPLLAWGGGMWTGIISSITKRKVSFPWDFFSFLKVYLEIMIVLILLDYIWAHLTYYFWKYEIGSKVLKIERGVIWKKYISIPYERIQNVDIYRGPIARILGLSELQVQTAGYSKQGIGAEGKLPGILKDEAEKLREELIEKIKKAKGESGL